MYGSWRGGAHLYCLGIAGAVPRDAEDMAAHLGWGVMEDCGLAHPPLDVRKTRNLLPHQATPGGRVRVAEEPNDDTGLKPAP
jgi:hypothetical protein